MARYDNYVSEVQIKMGSDLFLFILDDGTQMWLDRGQLAEALTNYRLEKGPF